MKSGFVVLIAILSVAAAPQTKFELVARWPDSPQSNYTRVFISKVGCERAKTAIQAEYQQRVDQTEARNRVPRVIPRTTAPSVGMAFTAPPAAPIAVCIPL